MVPGCEAQAPVVQKVDGVIHWIAQLVSLRLIQWIAMYPMDSAIHLLNNRGQFSKSKTCYYAHPFSDLTSKGILIFKPVIWELYFFLICEAITSSKWIHHIIKLPFSTFSSIRQTGCSSSHALRVQKKNMFIQFCSPIENLYSISDHNGQSLYPYTHFQTKRTQKSYSLGWHTAHPYITTVALNHCTPPPPPASHPKQNMVSLVSSRILQAQALPFSSRVASLP